MEIKREFKVNKNRVKICIEHRRKHGLIVNDSFFDVSRNCPTECKISDTCPLKPVNMKQLLSSSRLRFL